MPNRNPPPRSIALAVHLDLPEAPAEARLIADYLRGRGVRILESSVYDPDLRARVQAHEFDLLIAVGGDGTMLRAGHLCGPAGVPILGVHMGRLGFLMEIHREEWRQALPLLLEGDYWLEQRMMLRAEHRRDGELLGSWDVLNEVVVGRGEVVRPVQLSATLGDVFLTTYVADGLIASTPTGSTAYALAAGGPILPPELRNILLVPVAPHLSIDRAVVLSEGTPVSITVHTTHQAVLSVDGQSSLPMIDGDCVHVAAGEHTASFVRFQDPGYFYRILTSLMNENPSAGNSR